MEKSHRRRWPWLVSTAAVLVALMATGATVAAVRLRAAPPLPQVSLSAPATLAVGPASAPPVEKPASGSFALEVSGPRLLPGTAPRLASVDDTSPHPIASLAKALTALEVLKLRPLTLGEQGPAHPISAQDVADYQTAKAENGSYFPVALGQTFTEHDLLLALMLPSGNNIAELLARWAGGGRDTFLQEANDTARAMGMVATHLQDTSGFDPRTVSSAADLVLLAKAVLAEPVLAEVVASPTATLTNGTTVENLDAGLHDVPGWLGIKTGNTDEAGGCLLFAARRPPDGDTDPADAITVVGAVLGQHYSDPTLDTPANQRGAAVFAAEQGVTSAFGRFTAVRGDTLSPDITGTVTAAWGPSSQVGRGPVVTSQTWVLPAGTVFQLRTSTMPPAPAPLAQGAVVGRLVAVAGDTELARWPALALTAIPAPDWTWRLTND